MKKRPLEGLKVLDFTWVIAGPHAIHYLSDFGATVVHVESSSPTRADSLRYTGPMKDRKPGLDRAGRPSYHHRGKMSFTLNLATPRGREIAKKLVMWSDVVAENMAPGAMARIGLGYDEVKKIKPDIIYLSISNVGQTGPEAHHAGFGTVVVGMAGLNELTGYPDGIPVPIYSAYPDYTVPPLAAAAILAALDYRNRTGKPQYIDASQLEATLFFIVPALLDYAVNGRIQTRNGNRDSGAAPHGCYRCKGEDRWCVIAVFTDKKWESFCRVIGSPAWTKDSRFATFLDRKRNEDDLDRFVEEWTVNYTAEEVMQKLQAAGVAAGLVETNKDLFDDPQLKFRQHFVEVGNPVLGKHLIDGIPAKLSKTPGSVGNPPLLGEHNEYICSKILGMTDEEFATLVAEGVLQ